MARPTGYLLTSYGEMIVNEPRTSAYAAALRYAITPGCKVIDIGAGPGMFALLACQYGAGSVVAIDPDDSILLVAEAARRNGFEGRIDIVHGLSSDYSSARCADVIISDLRGILPLFEGHIPAIIDARERLLAPGGTLIPARDTLHIALVEHSATYTKFERPWLNNDHGIDLSVGHRFAVNCYVKVVLGRDDLLSQPLHLATLDYTTITDPNLSATVELNAARSGTAHGFVVWFDAELGPTMSFSNAPGEPEQVYGQRFFPFERPIGLAAGDKVTVELRADLVAGSYVWSWNSVANRAGHATPVTFRQSTFRGTIMSPSRLAALSPNHVPPALAEHQVDLFCVSLFDGVISLEQIARQLRAEFPDRFADQADAFGHATGLVQRYKGETAPRDEDNRA